ncbi:hypothetical protein ACHAWF_006534 [Thalassiosira exigua]
MAGPVRRSFPSKYAAAACAAASAALASSRGGAAAASAQTLVPIAMVAHYADRTCSSLDVLDFRGYYRDPSAAPGSAEAEYSYFCDPGRMSTYADAFGIRTLDSCIVDNGGNWYFQPLGFCGAFVMNNKTMSVKFTSIDYATRKTVHTVYSDLECTVPTVADAEATSLECFVNSPREKNGTDEVEANYFASIGSYHVVLPDAYNVIPTSTASGGRTPSVLISFAILSVPAFLL